MSQTANSPQTSTSAPQFPNSMGWGAPTPLPPYTQGSSAQPRMLPGQQMGGGNVPPWFQSLMSQFMGMAPHPGATSPAGAQPPATPPAQPPPATPGMFPAQGVPFNQMPPSNVRDLPFSASGFVPGGRTPGNNWFNAGTGMVHRGNNTEVPLTMQGGQPGWVGGQGNWNPLSRIWRGQYPGMPAQPSGAQTTNPSIPEQPQIR